MLGNPYTLIRDYANLIIIGDFNSRVEEYVMNEFCDTYILQNVILEPTCFKNVQNPTIIDMIPTNKANCFQNSSCIETGISDHNNSFKGSL